LIRKAVAINVAAVVLILVTVVIGLALYAIIWRPVTGAKPPERANTLLVIEHTSYNGTHIILYVRNEGPSKVFISRAYITTPNGTVLIAEYPPKPHQLNITNDTGGKPVVYPNNTVVQVVIGDFLVSPYKNFIEHRSYYGIKIVANDGSETSSSVFIP